MSRPLYPMIRRAGLAVRTAWLLLGLTLLLLAVLEFGLRGAFALKDLVAKPMIPDPRVIRDGYAGATWPIKHVHELESLAARWEPYVYFPLRPFAAETITIDDLGRRAVWRPPADAASDSRPVKILMLGGSALWGFGARDDQTIPSILARSLHEHGVAAEIPNESDNVYVNIQELVALTRELQAGYRPDVVLFYDGVNGTTSALIAGESTLTTNEVNRAREFKLLQSPGRLTAALIGRLVADSALQRLAQSIGRRFLGAPATDPPRSGPSMPWCWLGESSTPTAPTSGSSTLSPCSTSSVPCSSGSRSCSRRLGRSRSNARRRPSTPGPRRTSPRLPARSPTRLISRTGATSWT